MAPIGLSPTTAQRARNGTLVRSFINIIMLLFIIMAMRMQRSSWPEVNFRCLEFYIQQKYLKQMRAPSEGASAVHVVLWYFAQQ